MTNRRKKMLLAAVCAIVFISLGWYIIIQRPSRVSHPWVTDVNVRFLQEKEAVPIVPVPPENRIKAIRVLGDSPAVALSTQDALDLTKTKLPSETGLPYLVRGVRIVGNATAHTNAYYRGRFVYVVVGALGGMPMRAESYPLVVLLAEPPENVVVSVWTAR